MNAMAFTALLALLPEMDSTSIIVTTLVVATFCTVVVLNAITNHRVHKTTRRIKETTSIMQHALVTGGIFVVKFDMTERRVNNTYGTLLPADGMTLDEFLYHIHPDDRQPFAEFTDSLSQRQKGSGECTFRWHNSEQAPWQIMRNRAITEGRTIPFNISCTLTDETAIVAEQKKEQDLGERYRLIFGQSVVGLSFFDKNGTLLAANENIRKIFKMRPGRDPFYYDVNMFRRLPFQEILDLNDPKELHFCSKVTIPERGVNSYMELRFNPLFDDDGQLENISLAVLDITEEREMYRRISQNEQHMRTANESLQQYEAELQYLMDNCDMRVLRTSFRDREVTFYRGLSEYEQKLSFDEFMTYFIDDDGTVARDFEHPELYFNKPVTRLCRMRPLFHNTNSWEWNMLDCTPFYDKNGQIEGSLGIVRNMTALMAVQEQLKEETRRANDSARQKSVFMANMTHEIRTPLNSIVGFSDLLPMIDSSEEKREMVKVIMTNCDMLLRLINDILEVSTMDSNAILLEPEAVDFAQVFNDICISLEQRVQTPGVEFIKENPCTSLPTVVDQRRIQQVITNFVTNAVKYTTQGHIRVGYITTPSSNSSQHAKLPQEKGLYIYCEDTGAGIPKDKQEAVFERFVKLNDYVQGTGLGLAICKAIATRMGGTIGVESEGEGHGSTFWIWIPCEFGEIE